MKAPVRALLALSWLGTVLMALGCYPSKEQPPPPAPAPVPVPSKTPLGTYILVQLGNLSTLTFDHEEKCRGSEVGSTVLPWKLETSIILLKYLGRLTRLTKLIRDNLESTYLLEVQLEPVKGAFMAVDLRATGHTDALPFAQPTPELVVEYKALTQLLHVKREKGISGQRMLGLTRGLNLTKYIEPHLDEALEPLKQIVRKSIVVNTIPERTEIGPEFRGADVGVFVKFRLPNHEISLDLCEQVLADDTIEAQTCEVVAS
jgi:hypothetical protein